MSRSLQIGGIAALSFAAALVLHLRFVAEVANLPWAALFPDAGAWTLRAAQLRAVAAAAGVGLATAWAGFALGSPIAALVAGVLGATYGTAWFASAAPGAVHFAGLGIAAVLALATRKLPVPVSGIVAALLGAGTFAIFSAHAPPAPEAWRYLAPRATLLTAPYALPFSALYAAGFLGAIWTYERREYLPLAIFLVIAVTPLLQEGRDPRLLSAAVPVLAFCGGLALTELVGRLRRGELRSGLFALVVLPLLVAATWPAPLPAPPATRFLEVSRGLEHRAGDTSAALAEALAGRKAHPDDRSLWLQAAWLHLEVGQMQPAAHLFHQLRPEAQRSASPCVGLARVYQLAGETEGAIEAVKPCMSHPDVLEDPRSWHHAAEIELAAHGPTPQAVVWAHKALELWPPDSEKSAQTRELIERIDARLAEEKRRRIRRPEVPR